MMFNLEKLVYAGGMCKQRLHIKAFKTQDVMFTYLNKQSDNKWQLSARSLKSGIYAFAGGQWLNVKTIDATALAHF